MLYLVGLGIWNEGDISLNGIGACKKSRKVYAEFYTSSWGGDIRKLEKIIRKKIVMLERGDLEERSRKLVLEARKSSVAVLVPGDPLSATTHSGLMAEASKSGVRVEVIHASSVFTAVAETGLSLYNFGRTVTAVAPQGRYAPDSFYDAIRENMDKGMHTLVLLDVRMSVQEGLAVLMGIESRKRKKVLEEGARIVVASSIGSNRKSVSFGTVEELSGGDYPAPAVIIIPGRLSFFEKEMLERLTGHGA